MTPEEINSFSRDYSRVSDTNDILWIKFEYANYEFYSWRIFLIVWCNPKKIVNDFIQKKQVIGHFELRMKSAVHSTPVLKSVLSHLSQTIENDKAKGLNFWRINVKYRQEPNKRTKAIHVKVDLCAYCFFALKFTSLPLDGQTSAEAEALNFFVSLYRLFIFFFVRFLSLRIIQNRIVYLICCVLIILTISIFMRPLIWARQLFTFLYMG